MNSVAIPYVPPPMECPEQDSLPGICDLPSCMHTGCEDDQKCCVNPCGSTICVPAIPPPKPCLAAKETLGDSPGLGAYVPQCNDSDGSFQRLQCHSHYCWCVDMTTGTPVSDLTLSENVGDLSCTGWWSDRGKQKQLVLTKGGFPTAWVRL